MADHPPRAWLTALLLGRLSSRKARVVITHLLKGCSRCRERMRPLVEALFRPGRATGPPPEESVYDAPVDRAFARVLQRKRRLEQERQAAEAELPRLLAGWGKSTVLVPESCTQGLCEVLLEKSWSVRHEDPKEMLRLSGLAREVADRLDPKVYGEKETIDLQARAWGEYANAYRVMDDLLRAEWALARALDLRLQGTHSPLLRARLAELTAGLFCHQRHFPAAFQALDLACSIYRRHGRPADTARVLVKRGIYTGRSGDPEFGIYFLVQALPLIQKDGDSKLAFITMHNILLFQVERGEFREASLQLFEMRPLYARYAGAVDLVKLRGIEGKIAAGLGDLERAERAFLQVKEEFDRRGQVYHSGIIALDLAGIWLRQGRTDDVKRLIGETLAIFRERYVARETIAALLMLREALDQDRATLELVVAVASLIEQNQEGGLEPGYNSAL
jgi:tetratricopeptide (TPR) repeat protein